MCHVALSQYSDTTFGPMAASACFSQGHQMDGSSFACTSILGTISVVSIFIILLGITLISKITLIFVILTTLLTASRFKTNAY